MSVLSEVEPILKVQNIDLEIIKIKAEMALVPGEINALEEKKNAIKSALLSIDENAKKARLLQKEMEKDIEAKKANMLKFQAQLNVVKKNEEYSVVLKEIDGVKKDIFMSENKIIEVMENVEKIEAEKDNQKKVILEEESQIQKIIQEKKSSLDGLKGKLDEFEKSRVEAASKCSGPLYTKYKNYVKKKQSIALVHLEKNGTCSGCHQLLPPNIKNEVLKGKITVCDNCARLLFWDKNNAVNNTEE